MAKTVPTNIRLTEEERAFLIGLGKGDLTGGLRIAMERAGYREGVKTFYIGRPQNSDEYILYNSLELGKAITVNIGSPINFEDDHRLSSQSRKYIKRIIDEMFFMFSEDGKDEVKLIDIETGNEI